MARPHIKNGFPVDLAPLTQESKDWLYYLWEKVSGMRSYQATLDPASVAANTSAEQTFTVSGLTTDDNVVVNKPSVTAGIGIVNARVSAANTLAITFMNSTAGAIDPASEQYEITAIKRDLR